VYPPVNSNPTYLPSAHPGLGTLASERLRRVLPLLRLRPLHPPLLDCAPTCAALWVGGDPRGMCDGPSDMGRRRYPVSARSVNGDENPPLAGPRARGPGNAPRVAAVAGARKRLYFMREPLLELGPVGEAYLTE
jgi:hypothetical protein